MLIRSDGTRLEVVVELTRLRVGEKLKRESLDVVSSGKMQKDLLGKLTTYRTLK